MIPNVRDRELQSEGVTSQHAFGISRTNEAHIMTILRDTLYSDRVMAPLREYSANAWDAHRSVGKNDVPIKVTLPTSMEPTLTIRDFGPGMSHEDVFNIYTQYGASTKRNSDTQVGMLGIGSKSAFAYADSFTITSWNGGVKRIYISVLDESDEGRINLMHEEPCGEETGIQIQIAVKHEDIGEFTRKSQQLFRHFDPQPSINTELSNPVKDYTRLKSGYIHNADHGYGNWTAVMGCVPYRINLQQITGEGMEAIPDYVFQLGGVINFNIGDVQINASREELKYSQSTKKLIRERINQLVDEYVEFVLKEIKNKAKSAWDRRLLARSYKLFMLPVPEIEKMFGGHIVSLLQTPPSFVFGVFKKNKRVDVEKHLRVDTNARIIIRDDERSIKGYRINSEHDYVVCKHKSYGWPTTEKELTDFLEERQLTGITVIKISTLPWSSPHPGRDSSSSVTPRPSLKVFELTDPSAYRGRALSAAWTPVSNWTPADTDVYVILNRFDTDFGFYAMYVKDAAMLDGFDINMPKVIGFRSTDKKVITPADCKGVEYRQWREKMFKDLVEKKLDVFSAWSKAHRFESLENRGFKAVLKQLGSDHAITTYIADHVKAQKTVERFKASLSRAVTSFFENHGFAGVPDEAGKALHERYPLLGCYGFQRLWESWTETDENAADKSEYNKRGREWIKYIKLIDSVDTQERNAA